MAHKPRARTKRILFIADTHCGAKGGLTPPPWQIPSSRDDLCRHAWHAIQYEGWRQYLSWLDECGPVDCAVHLGDAIDGTSSRSGGTEALTLDLAEQCAIARECIRHVRAKRWIMLYGTPYHTAGDGQDWDAQLARDIGAEIHDHCWVEVNGAIIDAKHKCGGSAVPAGGDAYLRGEILWSHEWALRHGWPLPTEIVRAHVHRARVVDCARSVPGLELWTKYGGRQCRGVVDFGLSWADVTDKGEVTWHTRQLIPSGAKPHLLHV